MKTRILTLLLLCFGVTLVAQKREIRKANNATDSGDYEEALSLLKSVEAEIASEDDDLKVDYYLAKGNAYFKSETSNMDDLKKAYDAYKKAVAIDSSSTAANEAVSNLANVILNKGLDSYDKKDFADAMSKFEMVYRMSPRDTIYLYNAANMALSAKDYDSALTYYKELDDLGYVGQEKEFYAIDAETGVAEEFGNAQERDLVIKSGKFIKPEDRLSESKRGEIAKNVALIYISQDKTEEAITAMENAKKENPDDKGLLQAEADMYYNLGNMEKYNSLMETIIEKSPDDPLLYYNLGVSTAELGDNEGAISYYKKALELDPQMNRALINIAALILSEEEPIVKEMNSLGTSSADYKQYDVLAEKRKDLYREALPYLNESLEIDPNNLEAIRTMMNIYYQLEDETKAKEMKTKLESLEGN